MYYESKLRFNIKSFYKKLNKSFYFRDLNFKTLFAKNIKQINCTFFMVKISTLSDFSIS